jgi:hypothetical protein
MVAPRMGSLFLTDTVNTPVFGQKWESDSQLTAPREWGLYGTHSYVMECRSWRLLPMSTVVPVSDPLETVVNVRFRDARRHS